VRPLLRHLLLAATGALAACTSTTEVRPDQDALAAAAQFQRLADDAYATGADPDVSTAYRDLGVAVARNGRISPVTIVIDGTPLEFLATAQQVETYGGPACVAPTSLCTTLPPLRSVIAWQKSDPRRVVQLTAPAGSTDVGHLASVQTSADFLTAATLTYFDGTGGVYVGTDGTQTIGAPATSDTPCSTTRLPPAAMSAPDATRCTRAELTASLSGTVAPPPFTVRGNTASGSHIISMAAQSVDGARLQLPALYVRCPGCGDYPPSLRPPVNLRAGALRAAINVFVSGALVTFELRITNPRTEPVTLQFSSGQQYDFRVGRPDGSVVWVWSADKLFTGALGSRTLGPGETVRFTATWLPTEGGSLVAEGRLTSTSHRAAAATTFVVLQYVAMAKSTPNTAPNTQ
jgi:hypothetical protein